MFKRELENISSYRGSMQLSENCTMLAANDLFEQKKQNVHDNVVEVFQTNIEGSKILGENSTELVIVKLDEPQKHSPSKVSEGFKSDGVKIHIINEEEAQKQSQGTSRLEAQSKDAESLSNLISKSNESILNSSQMETITLQMDENNQFEEIGTIFKELESNGQDARNIKDIETPSSNVTVDIMPTKINSQNLDLSISTSLSESLSRRGRNRNRCDICLKVFRLATKLAHHRSAAHSGVYFSCSTTGCSKRYKTKDALLLHHKISGHSDAELFDPNPKKIRKKKSVGSFPTTDYNTEIPNIRSAEDLEIYSCRLCEKSFKSKALLLRHSNLVHTNERPFECTLCQLKFKSSTNLKAHQACHSNEKKFSCDTCGKQFSYKTSLAQHIKCQHQGEKPFRCTHCNKSFSQNGNLQEHIRIHTGHKPFTCDICGRKFTTSSQHRLHIKRHKGEKPWACQFCPKAFLHKESWTAHMRRHRGDRPFVCEFEFCKKAFAELWALKKHSRLHTGEKPYICQICPKSFSDCSNLTKHRKTHERESSLQPTSTLPLPLKRKLEGTAESLAGVMQDAPNMTSGSNDDAENGLKVNKTSAKDQVWNILNEAASQASSSSVATRSNAKLSHHKTAPGSISNHDLIQSGTQNQEEEGDVQQIIYITYDAEDKEMRVSSDESIVVQPESTTLPEIQPSAEDDVLNQLSVVASNLPDQSVVIAPNQGAGVISETMPMEQRQRTSSLQPNQEGWRISHTNSTKSSGLNTSTVITPAGVAPTDSAQMIPQEAVSQHQEEMHSQEVAAADREGVYVDIRLPDNDLEEQTIRLKVPPNFDPIAYATEYIQLHTAAQSNTLIQNPNLELPMQNVEGSKDK